MMTLRNIFITLSVLLVAALVVAGAFGAGAAAVALQETPTLAASVHLSSVPLAPEQLSAKAALLYDPTSGRILFQKNGDAQLPLASITKLMSAYVALEARAGNTRVTITEEDLLPEGDWGLLPGDTFTLQDLLRLSLVGSSNDAVTAAAHSGGSDYLARMNAAAAELGLSRTYFYNPTGLDLNESTPGAFGSAYDVARLMAAFMEAYPAYLEETSAWSTSVITPERQMVISVEATAAPLSHLPGFVGAKTGYTDLAGGNLVAVFDLSIGRPVIAVVLGSTREGRFTDVRTLINAVQKNSQ